MPDVNAADIIIVGAGSAGCVLANRLTADGKTKVLLLEAGGRTDSLFIRMPAGFAYAIQSPKVNWRFVSEPEPGLKGRRLNCARGRGLGGSSAINAMAYTRGLRADFDGWAQIAGPDWSFERCLSHFIRIEDFSGPASPDRGQAGPLKVQQPKMYSTPLYDHFLSACAEAGSKLSSDPNGADAVAFGPMDQTIRKGVRESAATAFLDPARPRSNLHVVTGARVVGLTIDGQRATSVTYQRHGKQETVRAAREIILAAGAIQSPQILMLAGIGDPAELRRVGIDPKVSLPGVGRNLQDHVDVTLRHLCTQPISETPLLAPHRKLGVGLRWLLFRNGPGATNHFEVGGYLPAQPGQLPSTHVVFIPMLVGYDGVPPIKAHGFQSTIMLLRPASRGSVSLRSPDPLDAPVIRYNSLTEPDDRKRLTDGLRTLRHIFEMPAIRALVDREVAPGGDIVSDEGLDRYLSDTAKSTDHACGTCRMGNDERAVTDAEGRVHGIDGLRVVDASIMPLIPSANINAATLMLADKVSDRINAANSALRR